MTCPSGFFHVTTSERVRGQVATSGAICRATVARPFLGSRTVGLQGESGVEERKASRLPPRSGEMGGRITRPEKPVFRAVDPSRASW